MSWRDIHPKAVGVAFRSDREEILLSRLHDEQADETYDAVWIGVDGLRAETVYPENLADLV